MTYNLLVGLHIIAVIAWTAGLLYLPRLFVYHTAAPVGSELDHTFQEMERRLFRMIMNPAMIAVVIMGGTLAWYDGAHRLGWRFLLSGWMLTKLTGAIALIWWHHYLGKARKTLAAGRRERSERFWRVSNEATFLVIAIMVLAVTTKFSGS
ncbi:MAG TPA: CopD family protein [Caulobacteraceae bacterium]|nr:CopD family protein [Caulobacteraceae bacterium]